MILVDTGFLYALLDKDDAWNARAVAASRNVREKWITTWPVLTEAVHLIVRWLGVPPAESVGHGRILTTDERDFGAYRWKARRPFENLLKV